MIKRWKTRLYEILETPTGTLPGRMADTFLITLIVANVVAVMLHTVRGISAEHEAFFRRFELFSVVVFSIEYAIRMWICTENGAYRHPVAGRIRYFFSVFALIDLVAIAPFYLPMLIPADLIFMRSLRLLRLLRLLKLGRYSDAMKTMGAILRQKKEEIAISVSMSIILLLLASSLMYIIENPAQPDVFSSIPATMWWSVETMTTVGYGDILPITPAGKALAGLIAFIGISLFILPAGIIAAGYGAEIQRKRHEPRVCPKCGHPLDER